MRLAQILNIALVLGTSGCLTGGAAVAGGGGSKVTQLRAGDAAPLAATNDSEGRLRQVIGDLTRGSPNLDAMEPPLRKALEPLVVQTAALLQGLGPLQSIVPAGAQNGMDLFVATFQNGAVTWGIKVSPAGQIAGLFYRPVPAPESLGEEVTTAGLAGTLLKPPGIARPPVVLLIGGSGPTDRNGNQQGVGPNELRQLAEDLAKRGIASLRFDKRGIGRSTVANLREEDLDLDAFVKDAAAWLTWLEQRSDLGPRFVAGHSEGGLIAIRLAGGHSLAGLVLMATPGRRLGDVTRDQLAAIGLPAPLRDEAFAIISALEGGAAVPAVSAPLLALFRPSVQPLLRSEFAMDPSRELQAIAVPTLIVSGGHDLQVAQADADALVRARPDARRFQSADMTHVLKVAPASRQEQQAAYTDPRLPLAPGLVEAVADFVKTRPK